MRFPAPFRAFAYRNFRLFFAGQLISLVGTWMQIVAQAWLVYWLTGSSLLLGAVGFIGQIPIFLLSPVGGVVADRYPRHRLLIATQGASMLLAFVLNPRLLGGKPVAQTNAKVFGTFHSTNTSGQFRAEQARISSFRGKWDHA